MAIIGFTFTKIMAQKDATIKGKINISNNVKVLDVTDADLVMGPDQKGLKIHFLFESKYEPSVGRIAFEGDVLFLEQAKRISELLADWKKSQTLPKDVLSAALNHVLDRSNIEALIISRDLALPAPVPLPKVNVQQPAVQKISKEEAERIAAEKAKKSKKKPKKK